MDVKPLPQTPDQGSKISGFDFTSLEQFRQLELQGGMDTSSKDPLNNSDSYEKTPAATQPSSVDNTTGKSGLKISYQFDMFYELSQQVSAKMGKSAGNKFTELGASVAEKFQENFSLQIDGVGSFMNGTKSSLDISPDTTNAFFDAVQGLTKASPDALQDFFKKSDSFFGELKQKFGEAGGAFDQIKTSMQDQAKNFLEKVGKIKEEATQQNETQTPAAPATTDQPQAVQEASAADNTNLQQTGGMIKLLFGNNNDVTQNEYQDFLKKFAEYAKKFRDSMMKGFLTSSKPGDQNASSDQPTGGIYSLVNANDNTQSVGQSDSNSQTNDQSNNSAQLANSVAESQKIKFDFKFESSVSIQQMSQFDISA
ncbi:MAG: hypothetical protein HQM08_21400 [Candidatus Riflebacteria bacterium]|nr:hypothetical protein [Candidatus Riflebacteria bacterium]